MRSHSFLTVGLYLTRRDNHGVPFMGHRQDGTLQNAILFA